LDLKTKIQGLTEEHFSPDNQRLVHFGKLLDESKSLSELVIKDYCGDAIPVHLVVPGGKVTWMKPKES
jgi:hypothetical protein